MARSKTLPLNYVIQDENGCTVRYLNFGDSSANESITAVWLSRAGRIDFVQDTETLKQNEIAFEILGTFRKSEITEAGIPLRIPITHSRPLYLRAVAEIQDVREDAKISQIKEKPLPLFLKYVTAIEMGALGLVFVLAWATARFFHHSPTAVTVQVFSQQEIKQFQPAQQIVNVSNHKIHMRPHQLPHRYVSHRVRTRSRYVRPSRYTSRHTYRRGYKYARNRYGRPGTSFASTGALGVLGGMGPQYHGSGGLNIHSHSNNPGIGYGGHALRGGFERGMLGKGLIATGIGDGSSLQGYGGRYRHGGRGGGAPGYGYGRMRMAGSAGAYFEPMADDSIVEGGLDRDQINAVIRQNLGQITYCYEEGLQQRPNLAGRVAVHFVIGSRGAVTFARVANTSLRSRRVESCIVQKLRGWRFPRPTGNVSVRVTYPFVLKRLSQG